MECGLAGGVLRERGYPEGRLTFGSSGGLGEAISWPETRAGTWSAHGKESLMRPVRPVEIRPDQGEASRLDLARSRLGPRAVTTPAAFQKRFLAAPRPRTPSPAGCTALQAPLEPPPRCQFLLLSAQERFDRPPPDQKASPGTFPGLRRTTTPVMLRESVAVQPPQDYTSRHTAGTENLCH